MLTIFCLVLIAFLLKSRYLCNDSKHAAMRTQHFFIFTFIILLSFPVSTIAQDHSVIVEMNQTGPTTPKPRSLTGFSSSFNQNKGVGDKDAPGVWIDFEKKEMCVKFFYQGEQGTVTIINDSQSFFFSASVRPNCVNVYDLAELISGGRYSVIIQTPDKLYQGSFYYQEP